MYNCTHVVFQFKAIMQMKVVVFLYSYMSKSDKNYFKLTNRELQLSEIYFIASYHIFYVYFLSITL
jgi:hypothetical protein